MMKSVFNFSLVALTLLLFNCTAQADYNRREFTKTVKKEFDIAPNGTTYLTNKYGKVEVKTWDRNRVKISVNIIVNATSESSAQSVFDRIKIEFSNATDYVKAETQIESQNTKWYNYLRSSNNSDYSINYEVYLPPTNNLNVTHRYGDVYVADMQGKVEFDLKYANFKVGGIGDDSNINFAYGNGTIIDAKDLSTNVSYGKLNIESSNDLSLESKYSQISVEKAGDVRCETKYDTYRLGDISDFKNAGKYDNFTITSADNISLSSKYTQLKSNKIRKSVDLDMEYGSAIFNLDKDFDEASMNGRYTDFKLEVHPAANYTFEAVATYAGISYPDDLEITREVNQSKSHEVKGYKGSANASATIKATLNYGGLRLRAE